jgi:predicted amidohydrolase YtcJ
VVLARSPLAEPPEQLAAIPVLETVIGGRTVWRGN